MAEFGMQMPTARARRAGGPDVYTGLMFASTLALVIATVVLFLAGQKVGPNGNAFGLQEAGRIQLQQAPSR